MNRMPGKLLLAGSVLLAVLLASLVQGAALASPLRDPQPGATPLADLLPPDLTGRVEPSLLKQLAAARQATPGRAYRFIVELREQANLSAMSGRSASRDQVVAALQAAAARSQAGVLSFLDAESAAGRVAEVHPFWVVNSVAVTAQVETLLALAGRP